MQSEAAEIGSGCAPARQPKERLWTLDSLDGRTTAARRARALAEVFAADLGGAISPTVRLAIDRASQLQALAEDLRVRRLGGDTDISLVDLTRVEGLASRAVHALGIKPAAALPKATLKDYLVARAQAASAPEAQASSPRSPEGAP